MPTGILNATNFWVKLSAGVTEPERTIFEYWTVRMIAEVDGNFENVVGNSQQAMEKQGVRIIDSGRECWGLHYESFI